MATTVANRRVVPLGGITMEVLNLTGVTDADTVTSQMQRPVFGFGVVYSDGSPMTAAINPSISGRTITLNSTDLDGDDNLVLVLFGF